MPIREYECRLGHRAERIEHKDEELPLCPVCSQQPTTSPALNRMKRLISVPAQPQFKGSGFYSTDYKGKP